MGPEAKHLVIVSAEYCGKLRIPHILSDDPRLDFAKVLNRFFAQPPQPGIADTAVIGPTAKLGENVCIGEFAIIDNGVTIGDNTRIGDHAIIRTGTIIGNHCIVKSGAVIGEGGFGFAFETDGTPVAIPHIGGVVIGDRVQVGANAVVSRGTLDDTIIRSGTKINDLVHVAHNVQIGSNVIVAGGKICGSVIIGDGTWIAPHAVIRNKVSVGAGAFIGMGAVVTKSVAPNEVVVGNPARALKKGD